MAAPIIPAIIAGIPAAVKLYKSIFNKTGSQKAAEKITVDKFKNEIDKKGGQKMADYLDKQIGGKAPSAIESGGRSKMGLSKFQEGRDKITKMKGQVKKARKEMDEDERREKAFDKAKKYKESEQEKVYSNDPYVLNVDSLGEAVKYSNKSKEEKMLEELMKKYNKK